MTNDEILQAYDIVRAIAAMPLNENGRITAEQATYMGSLFKGNVRVFRELDEKPGLYAGTFYHGVEGDNTYMPWHPKLRQARNNFDEFWDAVIGEAA